MYFTGQTKRLKGLRFRLTFVYSFLFGIFICFFGFMLSKHYMDTAREDFDSALLNFALDLSESISLDDSGFTTKNFHSRTESKKHFPFSLGQIYYNIRSLNGEILSSSPNAKGHKEIPYSSELASTEAYTHRFFSLQEDKKDYRVVNLKISNEDKIELILQVVTPSGILTEQENRQLLINLITIPLLILISSISAYITAGNTLSPIKSLIETTNSIAAKNLSQRLPEVNTGDEIEELSRTFNNLLERLEKSFRAQEHFVANASHQLNTPLAIIKGELDVLESKERGPDEILKFQKSLREELERLIELVKNMLLISRVESGQDSFVMRPVRLDELVIGISSRLGAKAREKKITLRFNLSESDDHTQMTILGEKQLLDSLFENLLDNAIKYSPEESLISINIRARDQHTEVSFQDEGPGISKTDIQNILTQRFQRGPKVSMTGTGIGLSIAQQIATHHNGKITYQRLYPRGSLFMVRFPQLNT